MTDWKSIIGIIGVLLTFVGYGPYLSDIVRGKTKPHVFSWFLWGFATYLIFALQISGGAGRGAWVTFTAASMCVVVFVLGLIMNNDKDITKSDKYFLILAICSLLVWLVAKQPIISTLLLITTDLTGFAPTVRKTWNKPYSETLSFYVINTFRFALATMAIRNYSIVTALYPVTWVMANGLFAFMLIVRRQRWNKTKN